MSTISPWDTTPPDPPDDGRLCRVYGKVADLSGRPVAFVSFTFSLQAAAFYGGLSSSSFVLDDVVAVADRDGKFFVDLPRNSDLMLTTPGYRDPVPFRVPDTDLISMSDILFPHPVRLEWLYSDGADEPTYLQIPQDPPGFTDVTSGVEYLLTLGVVWSNCEITALTSPAYESTGWTLIEAVDSTTLRVSATAGTPATLVSVEEDEYTDVGAMWTRAGFDPSTFAPHFFPDQDYALTDTGVLTFTPA